MAFQSAKSIVRIKEFEALKEAGYSVQKLSEYHFRITKKGSRDSVDIWPTSHKMWKKGWARSSVYDDLLLELKPFFYTEIQEPAKKSILPELSDRMKEFYEYRKDPMKFIRDKMSKW